jgi:hypothetical protein
MCVPGAVFVSIPAALAAWSNFETAFGFFVSPAGVGLVGANLSESKRQRLAFINVELGVTDF